MENALRKQKEIIENFKRIAESYNTQAELYKKLAQEVKRTNAALDILEKRIEDLIEEYNLAVELEDDDEQLI